MERRRFLAFAALTLLAPLPRAARAAGPLLFHEHGHGLAFSSDGRVLLAPSRKGLAAYEDGTWWEASGPAQGFSGFAVAAAAIYASGPGAGLMRSLDGARTWHTVALGGEADLRLIAAGYRSGAIYVVNSAANRSMAAVGLFMTTDEGRTWRPAAARGLAGEIHAIGAHPKDPGTIAAGTGSGLFVSRDAGQSFDTLDGGEPVTALAFDHEGERILYARALSNEVIDRALRGSARHRMRLPALVHDYVTCLAHSPAHERTIALATRKLDVYLTRDGGRTWRRIASAGDAGSPETETHGQHP